MKQHRLDIRLLVALAAMAVALVSASPGPAEVILPAGTIAVPNTGSFLYLNSEAGDYIGRGLERLYTAGIYTVSASIDAPHTYLITSVFPGGWYVHIAAPQGQPLEVGSYEGATRAAFRAPGTPGLDVYGGGRGCNTVTGSFDVLAIEYDGDGNLTLFDATFEQHCEGDGAPALFGRIRFDALAPTVWVTDSPDRLTADNAATFSFASNAGGATFECKLDDAAFSACTSPTTYPSVGEGAHTFSVQATDAGRTSAPAEWAWTISPTASPPTVTLPGGTIAVPEKGSFLYLHSTGNDWVGQGQETLYSGNGSTITASFASWPYASVTASLRQGSHNWTAVVSAPYGRALGVRAYEATRGPDPETGTAGLDVYGDGRGCNSSTGVVDVHAIEYDGDGNLTLFDATFEQHCEGADSALFGRIRFDALAPTVAITDAPDQLTTDDAASFSFTSSAVGAAFECKLDDSTFSACAQPRTYSGLAEGTHTFSVQATSSGHTSAPASRTWTISATAPPPTVTLPPGAIAVPETGSFLYLNSEAGDWVGQGLESLYTANDYAITASFSEWEPLTFVTARVAEGLHGWDVDIAAPPGWPLAVRPYIGAMRAGLRDAFAPGLDVFGDGRGCNTLTGKVTVLALEYDVDGKLTLFDATFEQHCEGKAPALFGRIRFDALAPTVAITNAPDQLTTDDAASFSFTSSAVGAAFECKLDDSAFSTCASPRTYSGLAEGTHTFSVQATSAGHTSAPATRTWTIDRAPETTIDSHPDNPSKSTSATFVFSANQTATFECSLDGAPFTACGSPKTYTGLSKRSHLFEVRATDGGGNSDPTPASFAWTNGNAPKATITGKPGSVTNATASFAFTSSDPGATFQCSLDGGVFTACTSPTSYPGLTETTHTFAVEAIDAANRAGKPAKARWTFDLSPPTTTITKQPADPTTSTTARFALASSEKKSTFQCSLDGAAFTACKSSVTYKSLALGSHSFSARATDRAGNTGAAATWAWAITT